MDKWKKAVVHLECAADKEHWWERAKRIKKISAEAQEGKITELEYRERMMGQTKDLRYHGTAIFACHEDRYFLFTARHVLWDEYSAQRDYQAEFEISESWSEGMRPLMRQVAAERVGDRIFSVVFRVPSFDEFLQGMRESDPPILMNLGAGVSWQLPFSFSSPETDLAIISLREEPAFVNDLLSLGYKPISMSDITEGPTREGASLFTVGFPSSTALLGKLIQDARFHEWTSNYFSLPTFTFGHVSMLHNALSFYWADMSIYPGNSGGPVVEGDKLVGVVIGQPTTPIEGAKGLQARIPFAQIVKSKHLLDLFKVQEVKDKNRLQHIAGGGAI